MKKNFRINRFSEYVNSKLVSLTFSTVSVCKASYACAFIPNKIKLTKMIKAENSGGKGGKFEVNRMVGCQQKRQSNF